MSLPAIPAELLHLCETEREAVRRYAEAYALQAVEAATTEIMQAISDPENQPSQYGTVTLEYLSTKLKEWESRWFKRDEQAEKAEAERDQIRSELQRLQALRREPMTDEQIRSACGPWAWANLNCPENYIEFARAVEAHHHITQKEQG